MVSVIIVIIIIIIIFIISIIRMITDILIKIMNNNLCYMHILLDYQKFI